MSMFKKAEKSQVKLRIALTGPAGSGKTLGALLLAKGIAQGGKIAVIDTENGTASLYADNAKWGVDFDVLELSPPYEIKFYLEALEAASKGEFAVVIVDSLSHAWAGEGGILQRKEAVDSRGGNSFTNWAKFTPEQNKLVNAVLHSKTNIICTMRSKTDYAMVDRNGKQVPQKMGLAPIQREGFDYEFDVVLDVDVATHTAQASKDRTDLFTGKTFQISEQTGKELLAWQKAGKAIAPKQEPAPTATVQTQAVDPMTFKIPVGDAKVKGKRFAELGDPAKVERWLEGVQAWFASTNGKLKPADFQAYNQTISVGMAYLDAVSPVQPPLDELPDHQLGD